MKTLDEIKEYAKSINATISVHKKSVVIYMPVKENQELEYCCASFYALDAVYDFMKSWNECKLSLISTN